jgi:prepilin-type N-terminal cleavage/methylation domain-containing protein
MKNNRTKKGFTLIEILLAAAIFSVVILLATGTFSWASSYSSKLREMRKVNLSARQVVDDISRNIRLANGGIGYSGSSECFSINNNTGGTDCLETSEIIFMRYDHLGDKYTIVNVPRSNPGRVFVYSNPDVDPENINALLILQEKQNVAILYRNYALDGRNYIVEKLTKNIGDWSGFDMSKFGTSKVSKETLSDDSLSALLEFGGYGPAESEKWQQPFTEVRITVQSKDYRLGTGREKTFQSKISLMTALETRDYN